jgi:tetratricopeptide (TPR) repeat protein
VAVDSVAAALPGPAEPREAPPVLTVRGTIGASAGTSWIRAPWLVLLLALAPIPAVIGAFRTRRRRPRPKRSSAMRLRDAVKAPLDAASVRRLLHDALRDRVGFDVGLARANGSLAPALRHEGVTAETAMQVDAALGRLDVAVFGGDASRIPSAAELASLVATVDREARLRAAVRSGARALLWLLLLAVPPALARQADTAAQSWAEAQTAYAGRDFERAERHFLDVARVRPAHPNVWANLGTAAWQAGDTARAVQGWQRALRRAPLDVELRSRLALVRAVQDRGAARVPPLPVQLPPLVLAMVWLAGWGWLARRAWRGRPILARSAWLIAASAALLAAAALLDRAQRANHLAVIARSVPLRTLPVLGAEQGPAPLTGEVARVLQRRGAWAHVQLDGRREGWIAAELLLPLGDD